MFDFNDIIDSVVDFGSEAVKKAGALAGNVVNAAKNISKKSKKQEKTRKNKKNIISFGSKKNKKEKIKEPEFYENLPIYLKKIYITNNYIKPENIKELDDYKTILLVASLMDKIEFLKSYEEFVINKEQSIIFACDQDGKVRLFNGNNIDQEINKNDAERIISLYKTEETQNQSFEIALSNYNEILLNITEESLMIKSLQTFLQELDSKTYSFNNKLINEEDNEDEDEDEEYDDEEDYDEEDEEDYEEDEEDYEEDEEDEEDM